MTTETNCLVIRSFTTTAAQKEAAEIGQVEQGFCLKFKGEVLPQFLFVWSAQREFEPKTTLPSKGYVLSYQYTVCVCARVLVIVLPY